MPQVNGAVNAKGEIFGIGIVTRHFWLLVNDKIGIDFEWNPETVQDGRVGEYGLDIDAKRYIIVVKSQNAEVGVHLLNSGNISLAVEVFDR